MVLEALKWNVSRITAHDMLDHIIARLPLSVEQRHAVRRHAVTFVVLCITGSSRDVRFTSLKNHYYRHKERNELVVWYTGQFSCLFCRWQEVLVFWR